jgi:hypothetical protein
MWLQAPNIKAKHGFSTRHGGVSTAAFRSLNLGGSEDLPEHIASNRERALNELSLHHTPLSTLKQVHGHDVCLANAGIQTGDALVSNRPDETLAVSIADCYPLLFEDAINGVIGAAHAGWRGTLAGIAKHTIERMCALGADKKNIQVAIGQGISVDRFQVGPEVSAAFSDAGFASNCFQSDRIDLVACNTHVLKLSGISENNIWAMRRCTFEDDFFSYRRDAGKTGRMWGLISLG